MEGQKDSVIFQSQKERSKGVGPLIHSFSLFVYMRGKWLNKSVLLELQMLSKHVREIEICLNESRSLCDS